jgi:hypothetical protein
MAPGGSSINQYFVIDSIRHPGISCVTTKAAMSRTASSTFAAEVFCSELHCSTAEFWPTRFNIAFA